MLDAVRQYLGYRPNALAVSEFLPLKETLNAARAAGLPLADYIEQKYGHHTGGPSPTDQTIQGMASFGVFDSPAQNVCEIGPGSGRYLERTIARAHPAHYEIYETDIEWRKWLVEQYQVTAKKCDGHTLSETDSASVALVQAHKVFPVTPFFVTVSYLREIVRVVRPGGWVVFDIITESCLTPPRIQSWFDADVFAWSWSPQLVSRDFAIKLLSDYSISLVGNFFVPLYPGVTECLIFRKFTNLKRYFTSGSRPRQPTSKTRFTDI
jgi:hypothetical protein